MEQDNEDKAYHTRKTFREKMTDTNYRRKFLHTLVLFASFLVLGMCDTIHFTAFLDLAQITGSNVEQASVFYTVMAVGGLVGTLAMGLLFDKLPTYRSLLLAGANLGSAFTITSIPWSTNYYLTIVLFFICYVFNLAFDTGTHADLFNMWGADGKMFMQFLHFSYALGSILSPLIVEPFLARKGPGNTTFCQQSVHEIISFANVPSHKTLYSSSNKTVRNNTLVSSQECTEFQSRIHYAYLIAGILCFLTATVLVAEAYVKCVNTRKIKAREDPENNPTLPKHTYIVVLALLATLYIFMCAPGNTIPSYLMPFGVGEREWTKESIAYLTSVYWAVFAASRLLAVIVIKHITPAKLLALCFILLTLSMGGMWASVAADSDAGLWVCIIASSGGFAVSFPTGFIYVEKDVMKVTGIVASVIMLSTNGAGIVNPLLLGYLMQDVSLKWYIYLSLGQVLIAFLVFILLQILLRTRTSSRTVEIDVETEDAIPSSVEGAGKGMVPSVSDTQRLNVGNTTKENEDEEW